MKRNKMFVGACASILVGMLSSQTFAATVARVNGTDITDAEMAFAETEIGSKLTNLPAGAKKRAVVEYLIEAHLLAEEANKNNLGQGKTFDDRLAYYKVRALRDTFYEKKLREAVTEAQAKTAYDDLVAKMTPEAEVHARHILVKTEDEAKDIEKQLKAGAKFEDLATKSIDPGSSKSGGDLGFVSKDQTVKPFEDVLFKLEPGQISDPVQTEFGWHIIKVEEKRNRPIPSFDQVKDRLMTALTQNELRNTFFALREGAKVEMVDADLKKMAEEEEKENEAMKALAQKEPQKPEDQKKPEEPKK